MKTAVSPFPLDSLRFLSMPTPASAGAKWSDSEFQVAVVVAMRDGLRWTVNQFRAAARWSAQKIHNRLEQWGLTLTPRVGGFTPPKENRRKTEEKLETASEANSLPHNESTQDTNTETKEKPEINRQQNGSDESYTSGKCCSSNSTNSARARVGVEKEPIDLDWKPAAKVWEKAEAMPGVIKDRLPMVLTKFVVEYQGQSLPNPNRIFLSWVTGEIGHPRGVFRELSKPPAPGKTTAHSARSGGGRKQYKPPGPSHDSGDVALGREIWNRTTDYIESLGPDVMDADLLDDLRKCRARLEGNRVMVYGRIGEHANTEPDVRWNIQGCNNQIPEHLATIRADYGIDTLQFEPHFVFEWSEVKYAE